MIITELGNAANIKPLKNKFGSTILGILPAYLLTLNGTGWKLWPIFGASNQMLAALTLMILSIYFLRKGKNIIPFILPMLFIMIITIIALIIKTQEFFISNNYLLLLISSTLIILITWMIIESILQFKNK